MRPLLPFPLSAIVSRPSPWLLTIASLGTWIAVADACWGDQAIDPVAKSASYFDDHLRPLLTAHCIRCHGEDGTSEGDVDLSQLKTAEDLTNDPELIDNLAKVIRTGYMPPEEEPPLAANRRESIGEKLKEMLAASIASRPARSRTPIRRMNRFQYNNAVQDLFQLSVEVFPLRERIMRDLSGYFRPETGEVPDKVKVLNRPLGKFGIIEKHLSGATPFPQDLRAEHGFDNRGDHITLSPVLMESFLRLGRSVVDSPEFNAKTCGIWNDFFSFPDDLRGDELNATVRERLQSFLTRAFRRPAEDAIVDRYSAHVVSRMTAGVPPVDAMKEAAAAALTSPRFLYLYDGSHGQASNRPTLDDTDLASRLSFFLWGSIPDGELRRLANEGRLHEPDVLGGQVDRLLHDRRVKRFCDSFPSQWLQLERIISSEPDPKRFPQFYFAKYRASMHMALEPLLLFETILIENRSILEFIDSDFSYRSDLLESWYRDGKQGKVGPPTQIVLRRVPVSDRRQGGVITSAASLTMTSGTDRTKPITRGAWLATVILNDPPPPPPADVPPLAERPQDGQAHLTLRERIVAHREQAACTGCHQRIDPLGFALENFDATGVWRDTYENGRQVDAAGTLFGTHDFDDVVGLKDALLSEKDRFTRGLAAHLLSYATGRAVSAEDSPDLDQIVRETAAADYRLGALIRQVVLSKAFRR